MSIFSSHWALCDDLFWRTIKIKTSSVGTQIKLEPRTQTKPFFVTNKLTFDSLNLAELNDVKIMNALKFKLN